MNTEEHGGKPRLRTMELLKANIHLLTLGTPRTFSRRCGIPAANLLSVKPNHSVSPQKKDHAAGAATVVDTPVPVNDFFRFSSVFL
jgi:hypothetical protein